MELQSILSPMIHTLTGIAILYFITGTLCSEKYRPFADIVLGVAVVLTVISPFAKILNAEWTPEYTVPTPDNSDLSDTIKDIWYSQSSPSLKRQAEKVLNENYPQYSFTVRIQKLSGEYRIYISTNDTVKNEDISEIRNLISQKTGILSDYVNIYLQNKIIGDDDND